jgi:hypothetical protein
MTNDNTGCTEQHGPKNYARADFTLFPHGQPIVRPTHGEMLERFKARKAEPGVCENCGMPFTSAQPAVGLIYLEGATPMGTVYSEHLLCGACHRQYREHGGPGVRPLAFAVFQAESELFSAEGT